MGRFNLRVRPVYSDADQLTGPEKFQQALQYGVDLYDQKREKRRTEQNDVLSRGGQKLPDAPPSGIEGAVRRGIGSLIRRIPGVGGLIEQPDAGGLQPTGTFAPTRYPGEMRGGDFMPNEERGEVPGMPDPDDIVSRAIRPYDAAHDAIRGANRVVPPTSPVGALPSSLPRPSAGVVGPTAPMGGPMLYDGVPPERTFEYQGLDNTRYRMPQAGERERTAKLLEYGVKDRYDVLNDQRTAERERLHDERMKDIYAQRDETRGDQQEAHDNRVAGLRRELADLTGRGQGNSPRALAIRETLAQVARDRENRLGVKMGIDAERGAAAIEGKAIQTDASQIVKDPLDRRMLQRDPKAAAANAAREARVEQGVAGLRGSASRVRAAVTKASAPPPRPDKPSAKAEEARLMRQGLAQEDARAAMRAAGWPIK